MSIATPLLHHIEVPKMVVEAMQPRNVEDHDLIACVPHLRAFARFLTGNRERADDLVQDTVVRALTAAHQFKPGTNLKAWMFTILRNQHYNDVRRSRVRALSLDDPSIDEPAAPATQEARLEFGDFRRAFWQLGEDQREVLILIGASGLSYEEAARICKCPTGTIKSRVSRARRELLQTLHDGAIGRRRDDDAAGFDRIAASLGRPFARAAAAAAKA
jgi:RNA polymerase sigma-70 factor (ECF subfamily)